MEDKSSKSVSGFSKLSKRGKMMWIVNNFFKDPEHVMKELTSYWHANEDQQKIIDDLSENTISNFMLPYSVAPNFLINQKEYAIPMVIEESSVVAAASSAAKYWASRGGFHAKTISTIKEGCVYFNYVEDIELLHVLKDQLFDQIRLDAAHITEKMEARNGGIRGFSIEKLSSQDEHLYKLDLDFETCDSMGANFINSVLESAAESFKQFFLERSEYFKGYEPQIIMSILTNYTPKCVVEAWVECPLDQLTKMDPYSPEEFADRFYKAVKIARLDIGRATTHNKGIYNGVDAVVLATGNDFRAIEACGHAYAGRTGKYTSLSDCTLENGMFRFSIRLPMAIGTVGGLTAVHPIARRSLELLGNPSAPELMQIIACVGLAQNFAAVRSLVTTGIQKGHMRMHMQNILLQLKASNDEADRINKHFQDKTISFSAVRQFLEDIRQGK